jgi:hypothetical protein
VRMCSPLSFFLPFSPPLSVQAGRPSSENHYCCFRSHPGRMPNFGFVLVISKIVWALFSVPGSIRVVRSLRGLPRGKHYYFGHFCVWFSRPEGQTMHGRLQGVLVLLPCFTAVSLFVYILNTRGQHFVWYTVLLYIYTAFSIISYCSYVWFVLPPPFIVFAILTDPR